MSRAPPQPPLYPQRSPGQHASLCSLRLPIPSPRYVGPELCQGAVGVRDLYVYPRVGPSPEPDEEGLRGVPDGEQGPGPVPQHEDPLYDLARHVEAEQPDEDLGPYVVPREPDLDRGYVS